MKKVFWFFLSKKELLVFYFFAEFT